MNASDQNQLQERVQAALAGALQIDPGLVTPELAFGDLPQWDSMGHMEVMMSLEEAFEVEINADTIAALVSVPAICQYIQSQERAG